MRALIVVSVFEHVASKSAPTRNFQMLPFPKSGPFVKGSILLITMVSVIFNKAVIGPYTWPLLKSWSSIPHYYTPNAMTYHECGVPLVTSTQVIKYVAASSTNVVTLIHMCIRH